jgi:hypothetical protein
MIFDLEIQPNSIGLQFVNAGSTISPSQVPILYLNTNESNICPADFVSIDTNSSMDILLNMDVNQVELTDKTFVVGSDKILLTHIAKYSKMTGSKYPIFYRHKIKLAENTLLIDKSVKIYDETGAQLSEEMYLVESGNGEAYIYINKSSESLLVAEWADTTSTKKECLKLEPVFKDLDGTLVQQSSIGNYEFYITNTGNQFICHTNRTGTIFYASNKDFSFVKKPVANINEPWYLLIQNLTIRSISSSGNNMFYRLPEYYLKNMASLPGAYRPYTKQLCKILNGKYIKTQMPPAISKLGEVNIYIYDKITNTLAASYTTNTLLVGTPSDNIDILWMKIDDYSYDGVFVLNSEWDINYYIAYASYQIENKYYVFEYLDLNSIQISRAKMVALYLSPDFSAYGANTKPTCLFYAFIGEDDGKTNSQKYEVNGCSFSSISSYQAFLTSKECYHLAYVSVETDKLNDILELIYCGDSTEVIFDKNKITKTDLNLVYNSIASKKFSLQLNDVALSYIDNNVLEDEINSPNPEASIYNNNTYIKFVDKVVKENITISTKPLIGKNIINSVIQ